MVSQTLYDKEISVTLYRELSDTSPAYRVQLLQGYKKNILNNNKITFIADKSAGYTVVGNNYAPVEILSMEFYTSDTRKAFVGYRKKANGNEYAVYKLIKATGGLYTVDTIEDMKKGVRPDGSFFKTGDRVRVKENGTLYSVFINGGLENAGSVNTIEEELTAVLYINCTNQGLKPDMTFSVSLLPGQNCYNAILKIRNLNLADRDIRSWTRMVVTAGYRTGDKASYSCPIFASYIEEPNPDGITTFEGIVVGTAENILNDEYIEIHFLQEEMSLRELTEAVAQGISPNIKVECSISEKIMDEQPITMSKQTVYAENGAAVLSWLQTTVSQFIQNISTKDGGAPVSAFIQLTGDKLQIIALNGPNDIPLNKEGIINLDMVGGATFNGTALTVVAPWNPALKPGDLFYMPPEFINGSKLPNVLSEKDYRNNDNLYRVLTMSVSFASVENVNRMEILAVPAQWSGQLPSDRSTTMRADLLAQTLSRDMVGMTPRSINVGKEEQELGSVNNIYEAPSTNIRMFDDGRGIIEIWGIWTSLIIDSTKGNCLSQILNYYFFEYANGPKLTPYTKGEGKQANYYRNRKDFEDEGNTKALEHFQNSGCSANVLWWPLVIVGTYWRRQDDENNSISHNWSNVDPKDPDKIQEGRALYIPMWNGSWSAQIAKLKSIKDIWKYAYLEYGDAYKDLCKVWRAMYYYLGGTDELG
jgi:hypothetical protein